MLVRVLQRKQNQQNILGREREGGMEKRIYYTELAHTVMGPKISYHLPSASWRPRKAGGVVPVQTWAENQGLMVSQSQSEGQRTSRTDRCPSSSRGGIFPSSDLLFCC